VRKRRFFLNKVNDFLSLFGWDIGVDLGSSNALVYLKDRGVVIDEPMMMARMRKKRWTGLSAPKASQGQPIAYGVKAKNMLNREPQRIEVVSPIERGSIADLSAAEELFSYYLKLVYEVPSKYPRIFKPRVVVGVPSGITDVQKRAVKSIFKKAGAKEVMLLEQAVLAAIGLGLPINQSAGLVLVDVGGGKTEISVVSMGGVVLTRNVGVAGKDFDKAIADYVKMKYGMLIGELTAERVKLEIGNLSLEKKATKTSLVRGRDMENGLPKSIKLSEGEIREAMVLGGSKIAKTLAKVLDQTAPELMEDILKRGIVMVGRGSNLRGLAELMEQEVGINVRVANECGLCVIKGIEEILSDKEKQKTVSMLSGYGR